MSTCRVVGLRIRCPNTNRLVTASRDRGDYAIGPVLGKKRSYRIRCSCGELHTAAVRAVTKPTKRRAARTVYGKVKQ